MNDSAGVSPEDRVAASLVERIRAGNAQAETELVERYSRGVLFLLRRMSGDSDLADDLHQETFRTILERLRDRGLNEPAKLAGFIRSTARNLFIGEYRKTARRKTENSSDEVERTVDPQEGQFSRTWRQERAVAVRQTLGELQSDRDRQILYRYYIAEENKEELCADFGLSSLHFNRVLFRARQRFRQILESAEERSLSSRLWAIALGMWS